MSKQQKDFKKRKVVKYARSLYVNIPAAFLKKNDPTLELKIIVDKLKKRAFVKLIR